MNTNIFQVTDLTRERTQVLKAARSGGANIRDVDGSGLVMLPAAEVGILREFATWSQRLERLNSVISSPNPPSVASLGELAWLRVFDNEDIRAFADEMHSVLLAALADGEVSEIEKVVSDWKLTAKQLDDPLRAAILRSRAPFDESEFEVVEGVPGE